jgi:SH3 domain protein
MFTHMPLELLSFFVLLSAILNRMLMKRNIIILIFLALFIALAAPVHAKTQYVSDQIVITMRSGQGEEFRIIKHLRTGTPLEVLAEDGPFLRVRTKDGTKGWVRKRYITSETPKATVIAGLKKEIAGMKATVGDTEALARESDRLQAENKRLRQENEQFIEESERTERKEMFYWFLAGGGVLVLGWIIGRASRQKRYY